MTKSPRSASPRSASPRFTSPRLTSPRLTSPQWDPERYLAFADERGRPFAELVQRVRGDPAMIVDLGCGPGQLTHILRARWRSAQIIGVDSSPDMIGKALAGNTDPRVAYELADVSTWTPTLPGADLIISNAMFQWVPDQLDVIKRLAEVTDTLAFQVPNNFDSPSHALMREVAGRSPYAEHLDGFAFRTGVGAETYLDMLAGLGREVDAWETTYQHILPGEDAVFDWVSGTGARPVLQALPDDLRPRFEAEYKAALRVAYPRKAWGTVLPFARVFVVAQRPAAV
ncbi:MAG: methyltransferase domain-containing protein [Aeromicrobium sp.]